LPVIRNFCSNWGIEMKVSAHRYKQSRQGATLTSSKKFLPLVFGSILGFGILCALALAAVAEV
jgi:hypothetical protein